MDSSEGQKIPLRKNGLHLTYQVGDSVYKDANSPQGASSLKREYEYVLGFTAPTSKLWRMPEMNPIDSPNGKGLSRIEMPYYPGEVMSELRIYIHSGNAQAIQELLQKLFALVSDLRMRYSDSVGTLRGQTRNRFVKYSVVYFADGIQVSVKDILAGNKSGQLKKGIKNLHSAYKVLKSFPHFNQEYRIHGCLHLEHVRIDTDGCFVPIDFEHGANYPRRLKYQDEAYIFQNLLQNTNREVAVMWLKILFSKMENRDTEDLQHLQIALVEKMLGGIFELLTDKPEHFREKLVLHEEFLDALSQKDFEQKMLEAL